MFFSAQQNCYEYYAILSTWTGDLIAVKCEVLFQEISMVPQGHFFDLFTLPS